MLYETCRSLEHRAAPRRGRGELSPALMHSAEQQPTAISPTLQHQRAATSANE